MGCPSEKEQDVEEDKVKDDKKGARIKKQTSRKKARKADGMVNECASFFCCAAALFLTISIHFLFIYISLHILTHESARDFLLRVL